MPEAKPQEQESRDATTAERLSAPFYADEVEWKIQSKTKDKQRALVVPYIKARALQQRLDDALGIENWTDQYQEVGDGFNCALSILINGVWITKNDAAETVVMTTYDDGTKRTINSLKGTYSSAFKRVCTTWGVGRYLYDIPRRWVPIDNKGKFTIPVLAPNFYPADATRNGFRPDGKVIESEDLTPPESQDKPTPPESQDTPTPPEQKDQNPTDDHPDPKEQPRDRMIADEGEVSFAKQHNIPEGIGVPLAGKTLGDALNDEAFGAGIITYLAGILPNKKKQFFDPGDDKNLLKLRTAAIVLYDNVLFPAE